MITLKFIWMLWTGSIIQAGEHEGIKLYGVIEADSAIDYATKAEVMEYLETGTFEYNDFLTEDTIEER